ncbi:hypothetical protein GCM10007216_27900 [Thalassobacillus devorans]|uniref:DoxX family protein n=1 Tax=Thalassobacillus devorans TaxID=279813 RepID=A0ABQ1PEG1_9BACI|nr:DoxX family protein [Thalassobacillus devorans]NIK29295.1 putative membrane protein YphA (DoxX/SURF4 family) [Thalassobacillus devorans]GGC95558.1 hypothetical protein GCM10007216_27900 [Thalassobacillus devorans]
MTTMKLIRFLVAFVFITSALMKLLNSEMGSVFINLGLPSPVQLMYAVSTAELVAGILLIMGRYVKYATMVLLFIIIAAIILTKIPALHGGLVHALFSARLDIVLLGLLVILYRNHP